MLIKRNVWGGNLYAIPWLEVIFPLNSRIKLRAFSTSSMFTHHVSRRCEFQRSVRIVDKNRGFSVLLYTRVKYYFKRCYRGTYAVHLYTHTPYIHIRVAYYTVSLSVSSSTSVDVSGSTNYKVRVLYVRIYIYIYRGRERECTRCSTRLFWK